MILSIDKSFSCITDSKIQLSYLFFTLPKQPCYCEKSWNDVVCRSKERYMKMTKELTPSICICQKFSPSNNGKCLQFMMRCVAKFKNTNTSQKNDFKKSFSSSNKYKYKVSLEKKTKKEVCSCCFNQPDEYCDHFSCHEMKPLFEHDKETSCKCYSPSKFPYFICNNTTTTDIQSGEILNSPIPEKLELNKKDKLSKGGDIERKYSVMSSKLKENKEKSSIGMEILTNGIVINICGGIIIILIVGMIACFVTNNSKNSSQRSHSQIIDPNTEFLMDQRTNV